MKLHSRVTRSLVEQVKRFEGLRRNSARLAGGGWTIGYGHTRSARSGAVVSAQDAEALLYYDLSEVAEKVEAWTFTPLNQNQFEALTAFAFNIGLDGFRTSSVLRRINEGQILQAAEALEAWRKANFGGESQIVDALVRRRAAEKAHFLTPPEGFRPSPSPVLRPLFDPSASLGLFANQTDRLAVESADSAGGAMDAAAPSPYGQNAEPTSPSDAAMTAGSLSGFEGASAPRPAAADAADVGSGAAALVLKQDNPFGQNVLTAQADRSAAPLGAETGRIAVAEPPGAEAGEVRPTDEPSPFDVPPPPIEPLLAGDAPFLASAAEEQLPPPAVTTTTTSPKSSPGAIRRPRRSTGLFTGDHTLLFGAIGCFGVAFLAAALFSILFSRANPLNLIVGLIGILLLTPAGAFFSIRFLNARDGLLER